MASSKELGVRRALDLDAAYPRDSPPSPVDRYFCDGLQRGCSAIARNVASPRGLALMWTPTLQGKAQVAA